MKLKNKVSGDIGELEVWYDDDHTPDKGIGIQGSNGKWYAYDSLAELNEEWEDYEEKKEYWHIDAVCRLGVAHAKHECRIDDFNESIGNYFDTKDEAIEALEKLKALKRLNDKGLLIGKCTRNQTGTYSVLLSWDDVPPARKDVDADMRLVFGGENG